MKAYKGFGKNLQCRGFQYEVGKTYETDKAIPCRSGFHACPMPLDVLIYYGPTNGNRFCEVEQDGDIKTDNIKLDGTKLASTKLKVVSEIGIEGLVKAQIDMPNSRQKSGRYSVTKEYGSRSIAANTSSLSVTTNIGEDSTATNTGTYSAATNMGDGSIAANTGRKSITINSGIYSAATSTGWYSVAISKGAESTATNVGCHSVAISTGPDSVAITTGDCSAAEVSEFESVAVATGRRSKAKGNIGCWVVLTERDDDNHIRHMQAICIDGKEYPANTYLTLRNGRIVVAD